MSCSLTVKAYCLKIPKSEGEKVIHIIAKLDLLNKELKVRLIGRFLYVPLIQKLSSIQTFEVEKEILKKPKIVIIDFYKRASDTIDLQKIIRKKLPPNLLAHFPRAIDFVGDIAIIDVPLDLEKQRRIIGEAVLESHKNLKTVLAKSGAVKGTYRLRKYENIAGLSKTETIHKENGCKYHLDINKVYFSPRLSYEHDRVASNVNKKEIIIDMFSGVGPFSVLIAKKHKDVKIYALDINPEAVKYLERNIIVNGVIDKVVPIIGDARDVIDKMLLGKADRVIMNLPEKAKEYLGTACNALKSEGGIIHYYEFVKDSNYQKTIKKRLTEIIEGKGHKIKKFLSVRRVRQVAPYIWHIAVDMVIH
jgi:tRNA (guanine37-N1)-methyltransferase